MLRCYSLPLVEKDFSTLKVYSRVGDVKPYPFGRDGDRKPVPIAEGISSLCFFAGTITTTNPFNFSTNIPLCFLA